VSVCVVCGQSCIPMADYDTPVCAPCDAGRPMQLVIERRFVAAPRRRRELPAWAEALPPSYRTGPGDPADIAELMAAFDGGSRSGRPRRGTAA